MAQTFNNLASAQSFAKANGIAKYWRVRFVDRETIELRGRGGWWATTHAAFRIYMSLADAMECIEKRAGGIHERTEIETLWTGDVSDSPNAK